jgi:hypothetical protein
MRLGPSSGLFNRGSSAKMLYAIRRVNSDTAQETALFIFAAVRTSNPAYVQFVVSAYMLHFPS